MTIEDRYKELNLKYDLFYPYYNGKRIQEEIKKFFPIDGSNQWIGQAHKTEEFEKKIGEKFGFKYALMTNSGTAALDLAYHLIGIGDGDSVIYSVLTCSATGMPLLHRKAKIVFTDIEKDTFNIDPVDVEKKITKKTKAIVAVALGGIPINEKIFDLGKKYKIPVVTDAAQAIGYNRGDYLIYSFQAIKQFTTCDGGLLVCRNEKDYKRAKLLRWFGIDRDAKQKKNWQAWQGRSMTFNITEPGFKSQPTDLDALLGLIGLEDYDWIQSHRQKLVDLYKAELSQVPQITLLNDRGSFNWLFGILVNDRDKLAKWLEQNKVGTNVVQLRNDIFKVFGGKRQNLPNMNEVEMKYLYLPLHNRLSIKDVGYICFLIKKYYENSGI